LVYAEKASEAVERLVESRRDTYQTVLDHAVGLQERNVRFAQGLVDTSIKEFHHQAESNRSVLGELFERPSSSEAPPRCSLSSPSTATRTSLTRRSRTTGRV